MPKINAGSSKNYSVNNKCSKQAVLIMGLEFECKIENEVKIAGYTIPIVEVKNFYRDNGKFGEWQHNALKILVDADLPPDLKNETKFHEILEAITSIYDIKIKHHKLSVMSVALHQMFKDN